MRERREEVRWEKSFAVRNLRLKARSATERRKKKAMVRVRRLMAAVRMRK